MGLLVAASIRKRRFVSKIKTEENEIMCHFRAKRYFFNHFECMKSAIKFIQFLHADTIIDRKASHYFTSLIPENCVQLKLPLYSNFSSIIQFDNMPLLPIVFPHLNTVAFI